MEKKIHFLHLWEKESAKIKVSRLLIWFYEAELPTVFFVFTPSLELPPNSSVTILLLALEGKTHACDILIIHQLMDSNSCKQICLVLRPPSTELQTSKCSSHPTGETSSKITKIDRKMTGIYSCAQPDLSLAHMLTAVTNTLSLLVLF